ncbi:MAG: response regulator [Burkholderiaceae bacterium]|nr:response regulator [Aquabacterium sp.]NUP87324.1 response regulator [Burkholderiaceae bacterium]
MNTQNGRPHPSHPLAAPRRERVLYVEDDPVGAELMGALVDHMFPGIVLRLADCMVEGVVQARTWRPDLILLDMQLPDGDGLDMVRELAPEIARGEFCVVLLTADRLAPSVAKALALGALACWSKPLHAGLLAQQMATVMEHLLTVRRQIR